MKNEFVRIFSMRNIEDIDSINFHSVEFESNTLYNKQRNGYCFIRVNYGGRLEISDIYLFLDGGLVGRFEEPYNNIVQANNMFSPFGKTPIDRSMPKELADLVIGSLKKQGLLKKFRREAGKPYVRSKRKLTKTEQEIYFPPLPNYSTTTVDFDY